MAYLDSSAINRLVQPAPESEALRAYLLNRPNRATSIVSEVEVLRFARRYSADALKAAERACRTTSSSLHWTTLSSVWLLSLPPAVLRSLDAIHIATALALGEQLDELVTYDRRMQEAALAVGLRIAAPA